MSSLRPRIVHLGRFVNDGGGVSAWCFKRVRAIDLRRATWSVRPEAVTCKKCLDVYVRGETEDRVASLEAALRDISEKLECDTDCTLRPEVRCGECHQIRSGAHWCAGCVARRALAGEHGEEGAA